MAASIREKLNLQLKPVLQCGNCSLVLSLDHSLSEFLQYQDQTSQYYNDLMNKLERMNGTLGVMLHYLDSMQSRVEERLHVIQGYLGWAGKA